MIAIFLREFIEFARRPRFFVVRGVVVALPVILIAMIHDEGSSPDATGEVLYNTTVYSILAVVLFVTPAILSPVLTEERRNNKLDVLRTAPLSALGIVLGKWAARTGPMAAMVVAALPLAAASLLFGGVSPMQFVSATLHLFVTLFHVSAFALFLSARSSELSVANRRAFSWVVLFLAGTFVLFIMTSFGSVMAPGSELPWYKEAAFAVALLNPFVAMTAVTTGAMRVPAPSFFVGYAETWFLIATVALGAFWIWLSVRTIGREAKPKARGIDTSDAPVKPMPGPAGTPAPVVAQRVLPRSKLLEKRPALWLELRRGLVGLPQGLAGRIAAVIGIVVVEAWFLDLYFDQFSNMGGDRYGIHFLPGGMLLLMALMACASTAASAFHRDDEARSLEVLHAAPLSSVELYRAKIASILRVVAPSFLFGAAHLLFGVVVGDIGFVPAVASMAIALLMILALSAFSSIVSLRASTSGKAGMLIFLCMVAHMIIWPLFIAIAMSGTHFDGDAVPLMMIGHHPFFLSALPIVLAHERFSDFGPEWYVFPLMHLFVYAAFTVTVLGTQGPRLYSARRKDNWIKT